ncbi:MAG: hypothetical protein LBR60_05100 [Fibrobacter sp.]|nr:hypothetical protein [Fibrobacter sp.]
MEIKMTCPHCGLHMNVSLKGKPSAMIVFVCSHCHSPLMRFENEVFELDREEFAVLRKKLSRIVDALLEKSNENFTPAERGIEDEKFGLESAELVPMFVTEEVPAPEGFISDSEISDLLIDLETCNDVSDFIKRL